MRIVLIDDDLDTHDYITLYLKSEGFEIYSAYTASEGLELTQQKDPDLVILDILMPQMNGWDTCRRIRTFSNVPVLMISAVACNETDIVHGLSIGADEYLTKPLKPLILQARINALLRRSNNATWRHSRQRYVDSHLAADLYRKEVFVRGERVSLSFLEYRLLELLIINAGIAVPTAEIIEELWSEDANNSHDRYVRIYIGRLRKLIEPEPHEPRYIVTEHGFGYRFNPQV